MECVLARESGLNLKATELRLGLPGTTDEDCKEHIIISASKTNNNKRLSPEEDSTGSSNCIGVEKSSLQEASPAPKTQIVGWPPVRSYRKNNLQQQKKTDPETGNYVKVSMDGAPYLRKIDLKLFNGYSELLKAMETMFKLTIGEYTEREGYKGSEYAPAYEDKDGDLMLVGDVPWNMFISTCKRLRIMKGSDAVGLKY